MRVCRKPLLRGPSSPLAPGPFPENIRVQPNGPGPGTEQSRTVPGTGDRLGTRLPARQPDKETKRVGLLSSPAQSVSGGALLQRTACALPRGRVTDLKKPRLLPRSCLHRTSRVRRKSHIEQVFELSVCPTGFQGRRKPGQEALVPDTLPNLSLGKSSGQSPQGRIP